jgi:integrase
VHVGADRLFPLWRLAATTGLRRGELLGLTWLALDLEGGTLRVDQQLIPTRGGVTFGPPKSKRSRRTVALDADTVQALRQHQDAQRVERALAGDAYQDADLIFADELGGSIYPQRLTEAFLRHRKAADRCTSCGTRTQRSRSRTVSRCTSSPPGSAIGRRRCCATTRTCCRSRTFRQPSR